MKTDTSWESLFKPGEASSYFRITEPKPILLNTGCFSLSNAWWHAEFSRLIYHPDFYNNKELDIGALSYELIDYIQNEETSTHIAIMKVLQGSPCLIVVFRGSDEIEDWGINARAYQSSFNDVGKVHRGFKKAYLSIRKTLFSVLESNTLPMFITGHSLGAALALLASSELDGNKNFDSCYTFGSPRIGNSGFINSVKTQNIFRIINNSDVVTTVPIDFTTIEYKHLGKGYLIDDCFHLHKEMSEKDVYDYQKSKLVSLKDYTLSKLFNNKLSSIKYDLPSFLADHSPINYTNALQQLLNQQ